MTDGQFIWYIGVQIAAAVATLVLAVVAIWGVAIKARLVGPKLELVLHDPEGDPIEMHAKDGSIHPARWYHLRLTNKRRFATAHNARVVVTVISRPAADGTVDMCPCPGPLQLFWQYPATLPQYLTLGPDRICDLGYLTKDEKFKLALMVTPHNTDPYLAAKEEMYVEVVGQADEAESKPLRLRISWDGLWEEDTAKMTKHLVVKPVVDSGQGPWAISLHR